MGELDAFIEHAKRFNIEPIIKGMLVSIGENVRSRTIERFEQQIDPIGKAWDELDPLTIKHRKNTSSSGTQILMDKGLLRQSMDAQLNIDESNSSVSFSVNPVKAGFNQSYTIHHQYGTKHMPDRPILDLKEQDKEEDKMIEDAILDAMDLLAKEFMDV